ncbi:MAG TPA: HPP family protein [Flavobacterium sp.]|nr:HPP family protein [Flavobacterium sp.]
MVKEKIHRAYRVSRYIVYKETLFDLRENFWTFLGAFLGIGIIGFVQSFSFSVSENIFLIGSFGASSVLIYAEIRSPLAQPRNLIGGHVISAFIGVTIAKFIPDILWLKGALAVSLSIIAMQHTKTLHPPGGATALIAAVTGTEKIKSLGYMFVIFPVFTGVIILLVIALVVNNMTSHRKYPNEGRFSRRFKWFIAPIRQKSEIIKHKRKKILRLKN